jgi:hypothetical protein
LRLLMLLWMNSVLKMLKCCLNFSFTSDFGHQNVSFVSQFGPNITKRRYTRGYWYIQGLKRAIRAVGFFMALLELLEASPEARWSHYIRTLCS